MIETLRRIDRAWARGEGWLVVLVLILMVLVAGFAASVRNLTRFDIGWANALLNDMDWADSLLRKGTLWLAFLGASLATHQGKHINIDILLRVAPAKAKYTMQAISSVVASLIAIGLVVSFSSAVYLNLTERPVEYELLGPDGGSMHVCDATAKELAEIPDLDRPSMFCAARSVLNAVSVPAETPGAAFQLIVPIMLVIIALRFLGHAAHYTSVVMGGPEAIEKEDTEERRVIAAQQQVTRAPQVGEAGEGGQS